MPLFLLPPLFKEYLYPQVRINKMVNVSITTLVIPDFPKDTPCDFYWLLKVYYVFPEYLEFSLMPALGTMAGEMFEICPI